LLWGSLAAACLVVTIAWIHPDEAAQRPAIALQPRGDAAQPVASAAAPAVAGFRMAPLANFAEVTSRPLFSSDRRPPKPLARAAEPGTPIVLSGIIILPERRYALIRDGASPMAKRVAEGDSIPFGTIKRILPDHIEIVVGNDANAVIKLFASSTTLKAASSQAARPGEIRPEPRTQRPTAPSVLPMSNAGASHDGTSANDAPPRSSLTSG
jgi:hypothetical protein